MINKKKFRFHNKISPKKPENPVYKKEEEELLRSLKTELKKERDEFALEGVEKMNENSNIEIDSTEKEYEVKIVGISKPVGFWTSLILGDQLSQIISGAQALNDRSHKGFWVSMLESQARGLGRQRGRQK